MTSNTSQTQSSSTSNVVHVEGKTTQPMSSSGNGTTTIGVTSSAVTQAVVSTAEQEVVTPPPQRTTSFIASSLSQPISLSLRPTASRQVTFPQVTREYPWGMPTSFTYGVHTSPLTYADNSVAVFSPFHNHNASGSAVNNNRVIQSQAGLSIGQ